MVAKSVKLVTCFLNSSALTRPLAVLGAVSATLGAASGQSLPANALPQGGNVVGGSAAISQTSNTLNVNQSTNRTVIDWRSFDIGSAAQVNFSQPNSGSIAVNRVNSSANPTQIEGNLHANGQVWILNPNGVYFGSNARVDAAGIVATTANVDTKQFMAGNSRLQMTGADHGAVTNAGNITIGDNGLAAFVAPSVRNSGMINARVGRVSLAAGTTFTLDLAGDHLVEIGLGSAKAVVDQAGQIVNPGGTVALTAKAAGQVVNSVINVSGTVEASSAKQVGGDIVLGGDDITTTSSAVLKADGGQSGNGGTITAVATSQGNYAGTFSARGGATGGNGGKIETSGKTVKIAADVKIDASAPRGDAGSWTIDPSDITIDSTLGDTIQSTLAGGTGMLVSTEAGTGGSGDITLTSSVNATGSNGADLTLTGRHLLATGGNTINISGVGSSLILNINAVNSSANPNGSWINDALGMIGTVSGGSTINLGAGTYTVSSGNYVNVNRSNVTIDGAGEGATIIDARSASTYGLRVSGPNSNVVLENFTLYGATAAGGYGLKAEGTTDLTLSHITSQGAYKSEFDLNGIIGGTLDHLTADGYSVGTSTQTCGNGISFTDSQNITLTDSVTRNNAWGGLALYQSNKASGYAYQETGITVDGTNTFNEANGIYAENQSTTNKFGTLSLAGQGITTIAQYQAAPNDFYTFFQKTEQDAIDIAIANGPTSAVVQGYAGTGVNGNNIFAVGYNTAHTQALSINAAVNAANGGATINVLAGTYQEQVVIDKSLTLTGAGIGNSIINAPDLLGHSAYGTEGVELPPTTYKAIVSVENGANVSISGFTIDGLGKGNANESFAGIGFDNSSGTVSDVRITRVRNGGLTGTIDGTGQTGIGLIVFNNDGAARTVALENSAIDDFQKDGVLLVGAGLTGDIENNTITGAGNTGSLGQNGIELDYSAATIINNNISAISYNGSNGDPRINNSSGILLWEASSANIQGNTITGAGAGNWSDGILAQTASNNLTIANNTITSEGWGIFIDNQQTLDQTAAEDLQHAQEDNIHISGGSFVNNGTGVFADPDVTNLGVTGASFTGNNIQFSGPASSIAGVIANNSFDKSVFVTGGDTIFSHIQDAVGAASTNGTVNVGAGTYQEQVVIDKSLTLIGAGIGNSIIDAPDTLSHSVTATEGVFAVTTYKAIVSVEKGANAAISGFTIDGLGKGNANDSFVGIGFDNSSGTVDNVHITRVRDGGLTGTLSGVQQDGIGVAVFTDNGTVQTIAVKNSQIDDFQKDGVLLVGPGLTSDIENNVITGAGSTPITAQNGIELDYSTATIKNNTIQDISFNRPSDPADYSSDILLWESSGVVIQGNTITGTGAGEQSAGIYAGAASDNLTIAGNTIKSLGWGILVDNQETLDDSAANKGKPAPEDNIAISGGSFANNGYGISADPAVTNIDVTGASFSGNTIQFSGPNAGLANVLTNNSFDKSVYVTGGDTIFSHIQDAVGAASANGTVNVGAGTYQEQVDITKPLTLTGAGIGQSIIEAPSTLAAGFTTDYYSGPQKGIVTVEGGATATISNLTIDGLGAGAASFFFNGIAVHNANATINNVRITGIHDGGVGASPDGEANGFGIGDFNDDGTARTLTVTDSHIDDFDKNGMAIEFGNLTVDLERNTVTGAGSNGTLAQNGIELWGGPGYFSGLVADNTITGVSYKPLTNWSSSGIDVVDANGLVLKNNTITGAGTGDYSNGIYLSGSNATVQGNTITGFGWGVAVDNYYGASNVAVRNNVITGNGEALSVGWNEGDTSVVTAQNNDFSGNAVAVDLVSATAKVNATGNWWGTTNDADIQSKMVGADKNAVNFSYYLAHGTDTDPTTGGFQGDFSSLYVTTLGGGNASGSGRIQGAISNVDDGGTVHVNAGTYAETLDISKNVDIVGAGVGQTIILPTTLLATGVGHKYDANVKTTVFVHDASNVNLSGMTIDGNNLGNNAVVFWNNASGSIKNALIENPQTFDGMQTGQDLAVDATTGHTDNLTVAGVTFTNWNKNAIDAETGDGTYANGGNVNLTVQNSTFTGQGATGANAQNGIVLWEQGGGTVNGTIDGSSFANIAYIGDATAAGILVYGSPNGTTTVGNTSFTNVQKYISTAGGSTHEVDATVGNTFDGVAGSSATLAQLYGIEDKIIDATNDPSNGLVRLVAGQVFVTAAKGSIQNGVNAASSGNTINVQAGTYTLPGELDITTSLTLKGAGVGSTIITSNSTGYGINVTADNTALSGFTFNAPTAVSGSTYGIKVTPDTNAATDRLLNFAIDHVAINGGYRTGLDLNGVVGATIDNVSVSNVVHGNGIALTDSANVTITNTTTSNNAWGGLALYQTNKFYNQQLTGITIDGTNTFNETNGVYEEDQSASLDIGALSLAGYNYVDADSSTANDVYAFFQKTQQGALNFAVDTSLNGGHLTAANVYVEGWNGTALNNTFAVGVGNLTGGGTQALSINKAINTSGIGSTIEVLDGIYAQDVTVSSARTFNFGNVTVNSFTLGAGAAGSQLSGTLAGSSIALNGAVNLLGDVTLDTSANNGALVVASVDGTAAGAQALTLKAGTGTVTLGNLGATTRLGAVSDANATTLTGSTYAANSLGFGALTLTSATTTLDTSAAGGTITVVGDIFGTANGAQSLVLIAGSGSASSSSNGNISLQNAGTSSLRLNNMSASGNNFTALTVNLSGNFTSHLTGNQVFAADTLNALGSVTSTVAGNASGHIVAGGSVTLGVTGDLSGTISGGDIALTSGNITNSTITGTGNNVTLTTGNITGSTVTGSGNLVVDSQTVTGSTLSAPQVQVTTGTFDGTVNASNSANVQADTIGGTFTGNTVTLGATQTVNATVTADTLTMTAPQGAVTGTWTTVDTTGSGTLVINGETNVAGSMTNANQLVVEGFALPLGTEIRPSGEIVLPQGMVLGLLSPGGPSKPRVILVHDVRSLGRLLESGYVAIVIDLSNREKDKETLLASN